VRLAGLAVLVLLLAGCAVTPFSGSSDEGSATAIPTTVPDPTVFLTVTVWPNGTGDAVHATLQCDPPGGDHPGAEAACAAVRKNATALQPVRADMACTQQYGGPERARVRGIVDGTDISAELSRANGCEIARWDSLAPLLALG
jgi:subtilisin inhibitor-like